MASEDEDGMVEGRIVSPPALPRLVPGSRAAAEHVPAHDGRAGAAEDVLGERRARVDLAAFLAVALAERLERDQPVVELLTADPERMLWRLVRAGDEAVDRHRDVQLQLAHRSSLWRHARTTAQRVRKSSVKPGRRTLRRHSRTLRQSSLLRSGARARRSQRQ